MEDYILKEIERFGGVIQAILSKIGILKNSGANETVYTATKTELKEKLDIDIETLLESENIVDFLAGEHGFTNNNLEQFAELLFEMVNTSQDEATRIKLSDNIKLIYKYLEEYAGQTSFKGYFILKELEVYNDL